jgi:hypothetical protein
MAQRNRSSQVKREREQRKRERQQRKAEKATQKRERRFDQEDEDAESLEDRQNVAPDLPTEDTASPQEP